MEKKSQQQQQKIQLSSKNQSRRMHNLNSVSGANNRDDDSECLSDIDDAEVSKYLNSKKEAHYKRIIWEVLNMDYQKGKNQKRAKTEKKPEPTKELIKPSRKINTAKKLSSKINYDVLKKLEPDEVQETENVEDMDSHHFRHSDTTLNSEKFNSEAYYNSAEHNDDDFEHENAGIEEANTDPDYYGVTDYGIDDDSYGYNEE